MNTQNFSQTQLSNIATIAGVLAIIASKAGYSIGSDEITFILGAVWTLGWTAYNYYQRWQKKDLTLGGWRKFV